MAPLLAAFLPLAAYFSVDTVGGALLACLGIALFAVLIIYFAKLFIKDDPETLKAVRAIVGIAALVACVIIFWRHIF